MSACLLCVSGGLTALFAGSGLCRDSRQNKCFMASLWDTLDGDTSSVLFLSQTPLLSPPPRSHCFSALFLPRSPNPSLNHHLFFPSLFSYPSSPIICLYIALCPHKSSTALPSVQSHALHIPQSPSLSLAHMHAHAHTCHIWYSNDALHHRKYFCVILRVARFIPEYQDTSFGKTKSLCSE